MTHVYEHIELIFLNLLIRYFSVDRRWQRHEERGDGRRSCKNSGRSYKDTLNVV